MKKSKTCLFLVFTSIKCGIIVPIFSKSGVKGWKEITSTKVAEKNRANSLEHNVNFVKDKSNRISERKKKKHVFGSNREGSVREMRLKPNLKKN